MQDYTLKINSCGITDCNAEWKWDTFGFNDYDLWTVFRGKGTLTIDEECFNVEEGSCILIPPNKKITGRHDLQNPLFTINVHFDFLQNEKIIHPYDIEQRFILNTTFYKEILNRIVFLHYRESESYSKACLFVALQEFFSSSEICENTKTQNLHLELIQNICKSINTKISENCSLAKFASENCYSTTYLGKLFHKITGVTFSQYLLNARISQAKSLLKTTDKTVSEIAEELGYYDTCHFIRQFKSVVGCSPNNYR